MRPNIRLTLAVVAITLQAAANYPPDAEPQAKKSESKETQRQRELDAIIDALANRVNTAPTIQDDGPRNAVFFHEDYDYGEQSRIFKAFRELKKRDGNALWPRLVAHIEDKRYALTWRTGAGIHRNMTVGQLCALIAQWDLFVAFERLSPTEEDELLGRTIHLVAGPSVGKKEDFVAWCEERKGKKLYQMQIGILEWTLTARDALERLSAEQRDEYAAKVKTEIERLKKTREPVIDKEKLNNGYYTLLSEKLVKAFREGR